MSDDLQSSYRSIFKATSLFGGVQVWNILIQIAKQKAIAILLGPYGMGISGLFQSALSMIQELTALGLSASAVKNVAEANTTGDMDRISRVVLVLKRLVWLTGALGTATMLCLSPWLSKYTFGNYDYTIPFAFLSISLLFLQLSKGQIVVLQGMRHLTDLAKAHVWGSFCGLLISVPFYWLLGVNGIVPTLILNAIVTFLLSWYYSRRIKLYKPLVTFKQTFREGKNMLMMGIALSFSSVMVYVVNYIVQIYIQGKGSTEDVGLYTAGFAIVSSYVGLVFNAMTTDYYPRLASVNKDNNACKLVVNQQSEIALLLLIPIIAIFVTFAPIAVLILYSKDFIGIVNLMRISMFGILFKTLAWAISYQFIAKQEMKIFVVNEMVANILTLLLNIYCYSIWGLDGLGIAFSVSYSLYFILVYMVSRQKYEFVISKGLISVFLIAIMLLSFQYASIVMIKTTIYVYLIDAVILFVSLAYSYRELNKRMDLKAIIRKYKK